MTTRLQSNRKHPPRRLFWPAVCCGLSCIAAVGWLTFIPRSHLAAAQQKSAPEKKSAAGRPAAKKPATKNPAAEPKPTPLEQRPYRVRVSVAFAGSTSLMPAFRRGVLDELRQLIVRGFGRMWRAEVVENVWIAPSSGVGLRRLTADELLERFPGAKPAQITGFDKVFYLAIEAHGPRLRISGREWDARSQQIGPTETVATSRRREVAHRAFALLPRLFHPTLQVDSFDGWTVEMRIQGAVFPAGDERLRQVRVGDVILPYFRYADRPKIVRRIQTFDWTYILVDTVSGPYVTGSLVSAYFHNPLGTGRRRRVDILAKRARPRLPSSRLKMVYQTDETKPLIGYNVQLVAKRYPRDEADKPPVKQFSGRDGYVKVSVDDEQPVVWVYVYSGKVLLARVPYVPGLRPEETVVLPDDSIRLAVEGRLDLLQGRLIDVVARRATLMALAQKAEDDEKLTDEERRKRVAERFKQIEQLPGISQFEADLAAIREPALTAAERLSNNFALRRIRRMSNGVAKLIRRHLDMAPVREFRAKLTSGR